MQTHVQAISSGRAKGVPCRVPRRRHQEMLVIAWLVITASFLLGVGPSDRVHLAGLPSVLIPKTCMARELFGVSCPGCGLTRSFVHLAHFEWRASYEMHRLGWLIFLATLIQLPYRAQALLSRNGSMVPVAVARVFGATLIALLIGNWLLGLVMGHSPV